MNLIFRISLCLGWLGIGFSALLVTAAEPDRNTPDEKPHRAATAKQLTDEALYNEIYGDYQQRDALLKKATETDPEFAPARWHQGYVKHAGQWMKASEFVSLIQADPQNKRYRDLKEKQPMENSAAHMNAANWCNKQKLHDRERGHLEEVLRYERNNLDARQRLGYVWVQGEWMTVEKVRAEIEKVAQDRQHFVNWNPILQEIVQKLQDKRITVQKAGVAELMAIKDPAAVLAMELILGNINEATAKLVVQTIGEIDGREAAESLARFAVYSPSEQIRQLAALKLRAYDRLLYVPLMLATMETPITNVRWAGQGANGRLIYRHALFTETKENKQLAIRDTVYRRIAMAGGSRRDSTRRAIEDMNDAADETNLAVAMRNMQTGQVNQRIAAALQISVSQQFDEDPRDWWAWWDDQMGVEVASKEVQIEQQVETVEIVDAVSVPSSSQVSPGFSCECLVAGTLVQTASGMKSIERISSGDLVLSKHPQSGELAFKPVFRTTVRPPSELIVIKLDKQEIKSSNGHPFWVSGTGWVMGDLKTGMPLHTENGFAMIRSVDKEKPAKTYNLVVADYHTYFVGEAKVLSHDFTLREAVTGTVPGLKQ